MAIEVDPRRLGTGRAASGDQERERRHRSRADRRAELLGGVEQGACGPTPGLARILLDLPGATPRRLTSRVADVLYATMTAESYTLFVTERGWSLDEWRDWAHDAVARELTPDSPTETSG